MWIAISETLYGLDLCSQDCTLVAKWKESTVVKPILLLCDVNVFVQTLSGNPTQQPTSDCSDKLTAITCFVRFLYKN